MGRNKEHVPLDIDWDRYFAMELQGKVRIWTARTSEGALIGYVIWFLGTAPNYSTTMWATASSFWVHPGFREGWTGVKLFKSALPALRALGVKVVDVLVDDDYMPDETGRGRVGKFLTRVLKFRPVKTTYELFIGD